MILKSKRARERGEKRERENGWKSPTIAILKIIIRLTARTLKLHADILYREIMNAPLQRE